MANIRTGPIVTDIRGKVGDVIFSRNRGGSYAKGVSTKDWTPSTDRGEAQDTLELVATAWRDTLTAAQRQAWRDFGGRHPMPDAWGTSRLTDGYYWYTRINFPWAREYTALHYTSPPPSGPLPAPIYTGRASSDNIAIALTWSLPNYNPWPGPVNLWVYAGKCVPTSVNYYAAPWRYAKRLWCNSLPGPEQWVDPWPFPITDGYNTMVKVVAQVTATGEISKPGILRVLS